MKLPKFLLLFVLLVCLPAAKAQHPFIKSTGFSQQIRDETIHKVIQTSDGFIWLAASNGLYRFDGHEYHQPFVSPEEKLPEVTAVFEDPEGKLWLGFENGKIAVLENNRISFSEPEEGFPKARITDILMDSSGRIFLSTYGEGIYYFENDRLYLIDAGDGLSDEYIYDLELDKQGNVWAGTDGGINICSITEQEKRIRKIGRKEGLPDIIVTVLRYHQGKMYIGMLDKGIAVYDPEQQEFEESPPADSWTYGRVSSLLPFDDHVWIGTNNNGLIDLHLKSGGVKQHLHAETGQNIRRINDMFRCEFGNIWIAAAKELFISTGEKFEFVNRHEGRNFANPLAIATDSKMNIWFSNKEGLFSHNNRFTGTNLLRTYFQDKSHEHLNIMSIYEDARGFIWAGTFGDGIYMLEPGSGKYLHFTEEDGLINGNVLSIDGSGNEMWFATLAGVEKCIMPSLDYFNKDLYQFTGFSEEHGLGSNFVYCVLMDSKNNIWFGTDGNGITCYNREEFIVYDENSKNLRSNVVYSITEDRAGNIWFSTAGEGLYRFDGSNFKNFKLEEGLRNLNIWGLETDINGNIVIAHDLGIDLLNTETQSFTYYGEEAGITELNPNLNAIARDESGNIWLGTQNGIVRYTPSIEDFQKQPLTHITEISLYLQAVQFGREQFSWDQNHISFSWIGLWYLQPEAVSYSIMLEGHDIGWIETQNRSVTYSDLPAGKYTFKVRSGVLGKFNDADIRTYSFSIGRPFWATFWFYLLLALILFAIVYYYIKFREKRLRKDEMLKKEKLEFEFQTLKNQVNPHFLFNSFSTLISLIEDEKDIAVEYVEKLSGFFRNILHYRDMEVISLKEELQVIDTYFFLQKKRYGRSLQTYIVVPEEFLQSLIPPLTLQMIVENALKHNVISRSKPLMVKILIRKDEIVVENNLQPKRSREDSTGVGLKNISDRYRILFSRQVKIEKTEQTYRVILPLIKSM